MPETTTPPAQSPPAGNGATKNEQKTESPQEGAVRAVQDATRPELLNDTEAGLQVVADATEWFLSEELEAPTVLEFDLNVAAAGMPARWVRWAVRALSREEVKQARRDSEHDGEIDDLDVNLFSVVEATIKPKLKDPRLWQKYPSPAEALVARFEHKPGIIEQLARKVNEMSGYGPDARDVIRAVDAAGN